MLQVVAWGLTVSFKGMNIGNEPSFVYDVSVCNYLVEMMKQFLYTLVVIISIIMAGYIAS